MKEKKKKKNQRGGRRQENSKSSLVKELMKGRCENQLLPSLKMKNLNKSRN